MVKIKESCQVCNYIKMTDGKLYKAGREDYDKNCCKDKKKIIRERTKTFIELNKLFVLPITLFGT